MGRQNTRRGLRLVAAAGTRALTRLGASIANKAGAATRSFINRRRAAGTRTASKLLMYRGKKRSTANRVRGSLGGLPSMSQFALSRAPSKRVLAMKRVAVPNYFINSAASQTVNAEGYQNACVWRHQSHDTLSQILAKIPNNTPPQVVKFVVQSCVIELLMTNSSLATQYVDIYDIVRKRDAGYGVNPNDDPTDDPLVAWKQGVSDQSPAPPDMTAWQNVMSKPTDSQLFNTYFKIVKKARVGLVAGATHRHRVNINSNLLVDSELIRRCNGDMAGITCYTVCVINGQPASIKDESGAVVTTATTALDVVWSSRIKYTWVADNQILWSVNDGLSSLVGEQITQPSLGAFVPNAIY